METVGVFGATAVRVQSRICDCIINARSKLAVVVCWFSCRIRLSSHISQRIILSFLWFYASIPVQSCMARSLAFYEVNTVQPEPRGARATLIVAGSIAIREYLPMFVVILPSYK